MGVLSGRIKARIGATASMAESVNTMPWYHGTKNPTKISNFRIGRRGAAYFSADIGHARVYGPHIFEVDLSVKKVWDFNNPDDVALIMPALRSMPNYEPWMEKELRIGDWEILEMRPVREALRSNGYDSYFVSGDGQSIGVLDRSAVSVARDFWVDRLGEEVPKEETMSVEASLGVAAASDAEYLAAAESGDIEKCQQMVDAAAKAAGYTIGPVYHGTTNNKLGVVFPLASHWGTREAAQKRIADVGGENGRTYAAFLRIDNPVYTVDLGLFSAFDIASEVGGIDAVSDLVFIAVEMMSEQQKEDAAKRMGFVEKASDTEIMEEAVDSYRRLSHRGSDVWDALFGDARLAITDSDIWTWCMKSAVDMAKNNGIDGIIYENDVESPGELSYVAFSPSQIKSSDPITYDDSGNIIPLSKRFNSASNDIRAAKIESVRVFTSNEAADIFEKIPMRDVGGRIGSSEKRGFAFTAPRWVLIAIDPETLKPDASKPLHDTKYPVIVSNGEVWDGRHRIAETPDGHSILAYFGTNGEKIEMQKKEVGLKEKYKALKAAGRISATGRTEEILAEDDWVRVKRMAVPEIDADSYIFTECKRETAVCIVRDADGRYLMRNEATLQSNFTPAPKVMTETLEEGETMEEAVVRGLLEEFGVAPVEPPVYLGSINGTFQELHNYHIYLVEGIEPPAADDLIGAGEGDGSRGEERSGTINITEEEWAQVKDFISWIAYGMMKQYDNRNILGRALCR